jgi:hypothetical protein
MFLIIDFIFPVGQTQFSFSTSRRPARGWWSRHRRGTFPPTVGRRRSVSSPSCQSISNSRILTLFNFRYFPLLRVYRKITVIFYFIILMNFRYRLYVAAQRRDVFRIEVSFFFFFFIKFLIRSIHDKLKNFNRSRHVCWYWQVSVPKV